MMSNVGLPLDKLPRVIQPVRDLVTHSVAAPASVSKRAPAEFFTVLHLQYFTV